MLLQEATRIAMKDIALVPLYFGRESAAALDLAARPNRAAHGAGSPRSITPIPFPPRTAVGSGFDGGQYSEYYSRADLSHLQSTPRRQPPLHDDYRNP